MNALYDPATFDYAVLEVEARIVDIGGKLAAIQLVKS